MGERPGEALHDPMARYKASMGAAHTGMSTLVNAATSSQLQQPQRCPCILSRSRLLANDTVLPAAGGDVIVAVILHLSQQCGS